MFDLFRSRTKAVRYLLGAILLLVALSMVVTLIPGFVGSSAYTGNENVVAEIGDTVLTVHEVQLAIQQQIRGGTIPREVISSQVPFLINSLIGERAAAYQARRMGFQVSDAELATEVQRILPALFQGGQFVGRDVYQQYLYQMNMTIPEFESNVRSSNLLLKLENLVLAGEIVSDKEVEDEFNRRNTKVQLEYIAVSPTAYRSQVQATRRELEEYFETTRSAYNTPEQRDLDLIVIEQSAVAASAAPSEEELRRIYQASIDRFRLGERVRLRQIMLNTTDKTPEERQQAKELAEDLLKQIRNGADFAELAKKYSEDTATAPAGGDIGWVARGQTVPEFENAAFALNPGQVSDVIQTEYAYHIIEVLEKDRERVQSFDDVRGQLAEEQITQNAVTRMQDVGDLVHEELTADPLAAAEIASKNGLAYRRIERFDGSGSITELSSNAEALAILTSLQKGQVTPIMLGDGESLVVAAVTEVYPSRPSEFAEVEDRVRDIVISSKATELADQKTKELEARMGSFGGDLGALARAIDLSAKTTELLAIGDRAGDLISMVYFQEAYRKPVGSVIGPVRTGSQTVVVKVTDRQDPDPAQLSVQRAEIRESLREQKAQFRLQLLEDGILNRLIEEGKIKRNERVIERIVASYMPTPG